MKKEKIKFNIVREKNQTDTGLKTLSNPMFEKKKDVNLGNLSTLELNDDIKSVLNSHL